MLPEIPEVWQPYWHMGQLIGIGLLAAILVRLLLPRLVAVVYALTHVKEWDRRLIDALSFGAAIAVFVVTAYLAVNSITLAEEQRQIVHRVSVALVTLFATLVLARLINAGFEVVRARRSARGATGYVSLARKISVALLLVAAVAVVLRVFGYDLTALIAGVGLISLGVGLALQDTMANFFAGLWLAVDRPIGRGDYVELESGHRGTVLQLGWRHTQIHTWDDNVVVVPNDRLAKDVVVNYSRPSAQTSVYVETGVSPESDLERVEQVVLEVAQEVQESVPGTVRGWEPVFLYREIGPDNVEFAVGLRITSVGSRRSVRHALIKGLIARFRAEGIEQNYPMRTVYLRGSSLDEDPTIALRQRPAPGPDEPTS